MQQQAKTYRTTRKDRPPKWETVQWEAGSEDWKIFTAFRKKCGRTVEEVAKRAGLHVRHVEALEGAFRMFHDFAALKEWLDWLWLNRRCERCERDAHTGGLCEACYTKERRALKRAS